MFSATTVSKLHAEVAALSQYQPVNVYPSSDKSTGLATVSPSVTVTAAGAVPWPFASKVTVNVVTEGAFCGGAPVSCSVVAGTGVMFCDADEFSDDAGADVSSGCSLPSVADLFSTHPA